MEVKKGAGSLNRVITSAHLSAGHFGTTSVRVIEAGLVPPTGATGHESDCVIHGQPGQAEG
jgi:hypothetical protein